MKLHDLITGTQEWHQHRLDHFNASEAAAMLGLSKHMTRDKLLHMKHTGNPQEFSKWFEDNVLANGHATEAAIRPYIEASLIGQELFPTVYSEGRLSVSTDGLTVDGSIAWEHKQWNDELAASVVAGIVPDAHMPQCQQSLLITKASKLLFTVSDGTQDKCVSCLVQPDAVWFRRIEAGWAQFEKDLAAYQPPTDAPVAVAAPIEALPALIVQVEGKVLSTNLSAFKARALDFIGKIKTDLQTDQDFADSEQMVKFLGDGEDQLDAAKAAALAQTASIDDLFRAIDHIKGEMRAKRLTLERTVKARKDSIRGEIEQGGKDALAAHIAKLNERIGKPYMPSVPADFAGAMRGKKTIASLRNAVDTELARAKIDANEVADRIQINLSTLRDLAADHKFLFADTAQIVLKANDDLTALVKLRIFEHGESVAKRAEEERIKQEASRQAQLAASNQGAPSQPPSPPVSATAIPANCTADEQRGIRTVGPRGGALKKLPNPTDADQADPMFEAIWQATKSWDVNVPEYYVGYCGMNGSHVMLILNAIRAIKPATAKTKSRKTDRT